MHWSRRWPSKSCWAWSSAGAVGGLFFSQIVPLASCQSSVRSPCTSALGGVGLGSLWLSCELHACSRLCWRQAGPRGETGPLGAHGHLVTACPRPRAVLLEGSGLGPFCAARGWSSRPTCGEGAEDSGALLQRSREPWLAGRGELPSASGGLVACTCPQGMGQAGAPSAKPSALQTTLTTHPLCCTLCHRLEATGCAPLSPAAPLFSQVVSLLWPSEVFSLLFQPPWSKLCPPLVHPLLLG